MLRRTVVPIVLATAAAVVLAATATAASGSSGTLFIQSAVEQGDTVALPLFRGTDAAGRSVYYVSLDTSNGELADTLGINRVNKLAEAANTGAVQHVTGSITGGTVRFEGSVDFSPVRQLVVSDGNIVSFAPGARGDASYSPLVQFADGTIVNAPQIARDDDGDGAIDLGTEAADKVVSIDLARGKVVYRETDGFSNGKPVKYVSTDASAELPATLEESTFASKLDAAPAPGQDGTDQARASLALILNGQTGAQNPERQGLASALAGDGAPLNVLRWTPNQGRYSPLWDVHPAEWSAADVAAGTNLRQDDWNTIEGLVDNGRISGPGGAPFGPGGFVVNCPVVSEG